MTKFTSLFSGGYRNPSASTVPAKVSRDFAKAGFGFKVLRAVVEQRSGRNALISPASIAILLHILYDATKGTTRDELANMLEIGRLSAEEIRDAVRVLMSVRHAPGNDVELAMATALWFDKHLRYNQEFAATVARVYEAEIHDADFSSGNIVRTVNNWVSKATRDKISSILEQAPELLQLIAVNAVYFKAAWALRFDQLCTRDRPFTLSDGTSIRAPLMAKGATFEYCEDRDFQAVRLYYSSARYAMDVVLPRSTPSEFLYHFGAEEWNKLTRGYSDRKGYLELPRFSFGNTWQLAHILQQFGLTTLFDAAHADFSAVTPDRLWLDCITHKTFIEVTESGTEAAAATGTMLLGAAPGWRPEPRPFRMIVDRPFVFAIREQPTGALLFLGVVEDPRGEVMR